VATGRERGLNWECQRCSVGGRKGSGRDSGVNLRALRMRVLEMEVLQGKAEIEGVSHSDSEDWRK